MSYERQDSTSRMQLYRERKVARMEAMRRAIDEGRTTVVSAVSLSGDKSPTRESLHSHVDRGRAESEAWLLMTTEQSNNAVLRHRAFLAGYVAGMRKLNMPEAVKLISDRITANILYSISTNDLYLNSTNDKWPSIKKLNYYKSFLKGEEKSEFEAYDKWVNLNYFYPVPSSPNATAEFVTKVLHEKDLFRGYASKYFVIDVTESIHNINAQILAQTLGGIEASEDSLQMFPSYYGNTEFFTEVPRDTLVGITGSTVRIANKFGQDKWHLSHPSHYKK